MVKGQTFPVIPAIGRMLTTTPTPSSTILSAANEFAASTVLIIDDDPVIRLLLRGVATRMGVGKIVEADNGTVGLSLAEAIKPDVILLDIMMPGMDGFEVCRKLRANPAFANTAILIQTGLERNEQRVECFTVGASDVVSKPLNITEFTARMKAHLRNAIYAKSLSPKGLWNPFCRIWQPLRGNYASTATIWTSCIVRMRKLVATCGM